MAMRRSEAMQEEPAGVHAAQLRHWRWSYALLGLTLQPRGFQNEPRYAKKKDDPLGYEQPHALRCGAIDGDAQNPHRDGSADDSQDQPDARLQPARREQADKAEDGECQRECAEA